ncbi:hypothetical protein [Bradyrhizobium sp. WSM471]|uniref:hypothetical protein n=1 Tax=Bradyrhizobium sp. WSM471 TaxID=319017 RepID=UPI00024D2A82|nr:MULTISPECIES: hypothetical protein [Bradyrhizobium]EHR04595.1 hypothetical protein Bra471DRAFT_05398 [Bradyrhizobium sp. WSM471]UFW39746.1 hypothetical protein BcanWSM471_26490 [Bradyrhizobium canariense]
MSNQGPTLYDLFDETSFEYWRRQIQDGVLPTPEQLACLLEANPEHPLPPWLRPLVIMGVRGQLKGKRGRPQKSALAQLCLWAAIGEYKILLPRLVDEQKAEDQARPAHVIRGADHKPPHQKAAERIVLEWHLRMDWRSFLNEVHSKK